MMTDADRERYAVAAHEAGHCVCARAVNLNAGLCDASISAAGHGVADLRVPFVLSKEADARQVAVMVYGGMVGQAMLAPRESGLDAGQDLAWLSTLAERFGGAEPERFLARCKAAAIVALACNWIALQKTTRQLFWTGKASWKDAALLHVDPHPALLAF